MTGANEALVMTFAMGAVILFCRAFPFLFFREPPAEGAKTRGGGRAAFLNFVEKPYPRRQ